MPPLDQPHAPVSAPTPPQSTLRGVAPPVTEYAVCTSYRWDYGTRGTPVAAPPGTVGATAQAVQVHGGVCYKVVEWVAERIDQKPVLPHPNTQNSNERLLGKVITPAMPGKFPDGTKVWRVQGAYIYLLLVPPSDQDALPCGAYPYDFESAGYNLILPADFGLSVLGPSPGVTVPPTGYPIR